MQISAGDDTMTQMLQDLQKPYETLLMDVDRRIVSCLTQGAEPDTLKLIEAAPIQGGKKVRSTFLFMMLLNPQEYSRMAVDLAAAVEMVHQASLIQDDVLDHAQIRRNRPALHHVVDNTLAVLVGDFLFLKAMEMVQHLLRSDLMGCILRATRDLIVGQIDDMKPGMLSGPSFERYINVLERKTGSLFASAAEMAGILRGGDEQTIGAYHRLGLSFGVLFQLQDDFLDLFSIRTGKDRWGDLREGKWTLPTLLLHECAPEFSVFPFEEGKIVKIDRALREHDIERRCREAIDTYRFQTLSLADKLSDTDRIGEDLYDLVNYVCRRDR